MRTRRRGKNIGASIDEDEQKGKKTSVHPLMRVRRRGKTSVLPLMRMRRRTPAV